MRSVAGLTSPNGEVNKEVKVGFAVKTQGTNMINNYLSKMFDAKDGKREQLLQPVGYTNQSQHSFSINEPPEAEEEAKVVNSFPDTDDHLFSITRSKTQV